MDRHAVLEAENRAEADDEELEDLERLDGDQDHEEVDDDDESGWDDLHGDEDEGWDDLNEHEDDDDEERPE